MMNMGNVISLIQDLSICGVGGVGGVKGFLCDWFFLR